EDRYIADSEDNIILLYLLYKNSLYKDKVSRCIKELGDEDSNELLKVGNLLANLFGKYHKDYYSSILSRAKILGKSIEEEKNLINEINISSTEKSKNKTAGKFLIALVVMLAFAFYYWKKKKK
ncbi:MAG: hypothetical protein ACP5RD_08540, partial [bacterium]